MRWGEEGITPRITSHPSATLWAPIDWPRPLYSSINVSSDVCRVHTEIEIRPGGSALLRRGFPHAVTAHGPSIEKNLFYPFRRRSPKGFIQVENSKNKI